MPVGTDTTLLRKKIDATLKKKNPYEKGTPGAGSHEVMANISVWPQGSALPTSFLSQDWSNVEDRWSIPTCLTIENKKCNAYVIDLTGDGVAEILLWGIDDNQKSSVFIKNANDTWHAAGSFRGVGVCTERIQKSLAAGDYKIVPPLIRDIEVSGQRLHLFQSYQEESKCKP